MGALTVSRRDLSFLLYEWLRVQDLCRDGRYAEHSQETFEAALDLYEQIANELFAPLHQRLDAEEPRLVGDEARAHPALRAPLMAFADAGLIAAAQDEQLGGMQLPSVVERAGMTMMMAANAAGIGYAFLTIANANLLVTYGTPQQIDAYARPMLAGRAFGTMCLSEPQAGSSLADITTRAVPQQDGSYRLFGNKMWISGGDQDITDNIVHLVLAKVPDEQGKLRSGVGGISLFLCPKRLLDSKGEPGERNDVVVAGINHKMGYRGTTNCLLNFGEGKHQPSGQKGAVAWLVGQEGQGLACMFHMMNEARIGVGLAATALGYAGYLHALDYARNRPQGRLASQRGDPDAKQVPIIQHADVRRMLLAQKAYVEGGLALGLYCAKLMDEIHTGTDEAQRRDLTLLLDLLTPIAKSWPSQWCLVANDLAIQVHGGYGYTRDYKVEQFYRDNRLNPIHEGTHGVQGLDLLGRKVGQADGVGLRLLGERVHSSAAAASALPDLQPHSAQLIDAWTSLQQTLSVLSQTVDRELRLANSSAFLEAFGHVVVAWLWLEQAVVACRENVDGQNSFYQGKRHACRYFFEWELPRLQAWLAVMSPPNDTCLSMREEWF
jgi:alkylation response protein AidB-like acyl-CoA dehydrogenase